MNDTLHSEAKALGLRYLGAPVSGGVIGAVNATLTIMVGGDTDDYKSAAKIFGIVGKNVYHLGTSSSVGTRIKLLNNLMIGFTQRRSLKQLYLAKNGYSGRHPI